MNSSYACCVRGRLNRLDMSSVSITFSTDILEFLAYVCRLLYLVANNKSDQRSFQNCTVSPLPKVHLAIPLYNTFNLIISFHKKDPTSLVACGTLFCVIF